MDANKTLQQLVERHFALEARLVASIDELNDAAALMIGRSGFQGATEDDLRELKPLSEAVQLTAQKVGQARKNLMSRVNRSCGGSFTSLKEYIRTLEPECRDRLNQIRTKILSETSRTQAVLLKNQAVLYYTYDFHRKYLHGVVQCDGDQPNYRADGQAKTPKRSNVYGRTC